MWQSLCTLRHICHLCRPSQTSSPWQSTLVSAWIYARYMRVSRPTLDFFQDLGDLGGRFRKNIACMLLSGMSARKQFGNASVEFKERKEASKTVGS